MRKIAMKCTQEQFDDIKENLKGKTKYITCFEDFDPEYPYLTNYYSDTCNSIGWRDMYLITKEEVFEKWDKNIFLKACGIETKYKITKETIFKYKTKDEFPEMFEGKLEVGKWYKVTDTIGQFLKNEFAVVLYSEQEYHYGLGYMKLWTTTFKNLKEVIKRGIDKVEEATSQEVETALINEAKKRGYKEGVYFDNSILKDNDFGKGNQIKGNVWFSKSDGGTIWCTSNEEYNRQLFRKGIWAEIIQTITKEEAEKKLNCKII